MAAACPRDRAVRALIVSLIAGALSVLGAAPSGEASSYPTPPADYTVTLPCAGTQSLVAGAPCSQTDAQMPFVSPALHPDVFERSAAAESSPPGSILRVEFFNAGCAESPAIKVSVEPFTRASRTASSVVAGPPVPEGTLAPAAPGHWAERVEFTQPELGQTTAFHYPTRHAEVVLSFSGSLVKCQAGGSLVRGYFEVRLVKASSTVVVPFLPEEDTPADGSSSAPAASPGAVVGRVRLGDGASFPISSYGALSRTGDGLPLGGSRTAGFRITKDVDASTPHTFDAAATGKVFPMATIQVFKPGTPTVIATYTLHDVVVASESVQGSTEVFDIDAASENRS